MHKLWKLAIAATTIVALGAGTAVAAPNGTVGNQGKDRYDADGNGVPDAGAIVTGKYSETAWGCDYQVTYRGDFGNTPYLDSGWILNSINCGGENWVYLIVHESDPRYRGNPEWAEWGTWEYHVLAGTGYGNFVRPVNHGG